MPHKSVVRSGCNTLGCDAPSGLKRWRFTKDVSDVTNTTVRERRSFDGLEVTPSDIETNASNFVTESAHEHFVTTIWLSIAAVKAVEAKEGDSLLLSYNIVRSLSLFASRFD